MPLLEPPDPALHTDPEASGSRWSKRVDGFVGKRFPRKRIPRNQVKAIEAQQALTCPQPKIPVIGLGDGFDIGNDSALALRPARMKVLGERQTGIQTEGTIRKRNHEN